MFIPKNQIISLWSKGDRLQELPSQLLLAIMTGSKKNRNQSQIEQAIVRPAPAAWGLSLLKFMKLEKLFRLGIRCVD